MEKGDPEADPGEFGMYGWAVRMSGRECRKGGLSEGQDRFRKKFRVSTPSA